MGTDIHFYVERRDRGKWVSCDQWEPCDDLEQGEQPCLTVPFGKHFYDDRNYDLFAILANVRNGSGFAGVKTGSGFVPISQPRGLPDDLSDQLQVEADRYLEHTPSWLLVSEIMSYDWTRTTQKSGILDVRSFCRWSAYGRERGLGPETWHGAVWGPTVQMISVEDMERKVHDLRKTLNIAGGLSNAEILDKIAQQMNSIYCEVSWSSPYYRQARTFLSECLPRLWRLGRPEDVRCVFWFDS